MKSQKSNPGLLSEVPMQCCSTEVCNNHRPFTILHTNMYHFLGIGNVSSGRVCDFFFSQMKNTASCAAILNLCSKDFYTSVNSNMPEDAVPKQAYARPWLWMVFTGRGFTFEESVFGAVLCKIQSIKRYIDH